MPKLWNDTIEAHRHEVRDAILGATAALVAKNGLQALTMSQIADTAGVARPTLYRYFPDVESILLAWHEQHVGGHLQQLAAMRNASGTAGERLASVLEAYAMICHEHDGSDVSALLHQGQHVVHAHEQLSQFVRDLLAEGAKSGEVRKDVPPDELANYCLHALAAARGLPSKPAVRRLVALTLAGLRAGDDREAADPVKRPSRRKTRGGR